MISSTVFDLKDERTVADEAISAFSFERFRSESMGALSRAPEQVCIEMASECDVFLLIVGARYGDVMAHTGISVVEQEFAAAREDDPEKILVFVKSLPPGDREPRAEVFLDAVSHYSNGYFRRDFRSPSELRMHVHQALSVWVTDRIRKRGFNPSALSLPTVRDAGVSLLYALLGVVAIALALVTSRFLGLSAISPSIGQIAFAMADLSRVILPLIITASTAVFAWASTLLFYVVLLCAVASYRPHTIVGAATGFAVVSASLFAFFGPLAFGFYIFGPGWLIAFCSDILGTLAFAFANSAPALRTWAERNAVTHYRRGFPRFQSAIRNLIPTICIAPFLSSALLWAFGIQILGEFTFYGTGTGIGFTMRRAASMFQLDLEVASLLAASVAAYSCFAIARLVQGYVGWTYALYPALARPGFRSKL